MAFSPSLALLKPFVSLSYPLPAPPNPDSFPNSNYYGTGVLDICIVVTMIAAMAVLRDGIRLGVLEPFAKWKLTRQLAAAAERKRGSQKHLANGTANGSSNGHAVNGNGNGHVANGNGHAANGHAPAVFTPTRKQLAHLNRSVLRFAEQGWAVIYATVQWTNGLYIHFMLPTRLLNPEDVWANYPHFPIPGHIKFYYLLQTAFYTHQMLILNAEARRKDHVQMMIHHVVTVSLQVVSYASNFTRVGCLIMLLMDFCDIFLPMAKMLRYLNYTRACDACFVWFLASWFASRHVLFIIVIASTYSDMPRLIPMVWNPEQGLYFTRERWMFFVGLLSSLQVLQIVWFWMICRVAWKVISGKSAEDVRSDDESDCDSEESDKKER